MNRFKYFLSRRPVLCNALVYGSLYSGGELSQQTLVRKVFVDNEESRKPYDFKSVKNFAIYGTCFLAPGYYFWYKWLDGRFGGVASKTIMVKLFVDQFLMTPPLLAIFYLGMSYIERKENIWSQLKNKWLPTYTASCAFWIPAQLINFKFLASQYRVTYVGSCSFVWVNILCYLKQKEISS